ncbi:MAG: DUF1616 domain-containing protein [Candidatus Bathyarchaeota archaeon]|nr:DUF1616 domain-containing protein [Candidatus Bathyarchaeum sp.]
MRYKNYTTVILVVIFVLSLFVLSPVLQRFLVLPQTEFFTELWLLGPEHNGETYPFNITLNEDYNVFLGVGNLLGTDSDYMIKVKFRNITQSAADSLTESSSSLPSLYDITFSLVNNETWELPIVFSFDYSYNENLSQVTFNSMTLNGVLLDITGSTTWNSQINGFIGNVFFELWIYNNELGNFQYHERYVDLKLNMTIGSAVI